MLALCEWASLWICRTLTGHDMTLCAYAWWRKDKWRRAWRALDWGLRWIEPNHTRQSYKRRFPK